MKSEVLKAFPWIPLSCFGLIIFFSVFVGILIWTFRKSRKIEFEIAESLPLQED